MIRDAAQAADPVNYDWSGFNVGVNAGAAFSDVETTTRLELPGDAPRLATADPSSDSDSTVFTGGVSIGYDWQMESFVFGLEADLNAGGFSGKQDIGFTNAFGVDGDEAKIGYSHNADWFGTLRGRFGYAADNLLFYGTAGLGYADIDNKISLDLTKGSTTSPLIDKSDPWLAIGWTAGGGIEYGVEKWSLGVEYLYVDLPSVDVSGATSQAKISGDTDYNFSVLRATAKLRF